MKHLFIIVCGAILAGCANHKAATKIVNQDSSCGMAYQHYRCGHAHIERLLGLNDSVLLDTNKFVLAALPYSLRFSLDKPLFGCSEASVYLDEMEPPVRSRKRDRPHQLRSVELRRSLPEGTSEDMLVAEAEKVCDEISDLLDVETPRIELVDIETWRKTSGRHMIGGVRTCISFDLANGQDIEIRLIESDYVLRNGVPRLISQPAIEIDITFNRELCFIGREKCNREAQCESVRIEKVLSIGDDESAKLAKAMHEGVERIRDGKTKRRTRKDIQHGTNVVSTVLTPVVRK